MSTQNNASDSALVSNHQRGSPSMNTHDDDLRIRLGVSATAADATKRYIGARSESLAAQPVVGCGRGGASRPRSRFGLGAG